MSDAWGDVTQASPFVPRKKRERREKRPISLPDLRGFLEGGLPLLALFLMAWWGRRKRWPSLIDGFNRRVEGLLVDMMKETPKRKRIVGAPPEGAK